MAKPVPTTVSCPNCGTPFSALVDQLIDVGVDPTSKNRLLSGQLNIATCPACGAKHQVSTPLVYHDPSKELAITYTPMEMGASTQQREQLIGRLTTQLMDSLPEDAPKGYLLQPKQSLTMQGLIEQVLEADGITKDVIDAEKKKADLVEELATAKTAERQQLLDENADLIDRSFFDRLTMAAQVASQTGDAKRSLRLLNIRSSLLETTEIGAELKLEQQAILEAQEELQAISENFTREAFVDLLIASADNPIKADALGQMGVQALDYSTFQLLTSRIDAEPNAEKRQTLVDLRERLLQLAAAVEEQSRAVIERAADTLRNILVSPNIAEAVQQYLSEIDDTFLQVLQANLQQARQTNNLEASAKLKRVRDEVLQYLQQGAPPEVQLINDLLTEPSEDVALKMLNERQSELSPQFLELLDGLSQQLAASGNHVAVERVELLAKEAQKLLV